MIWVLLQSESPWQRNDAITLFIYLRISPYRVFFLRNRLREFVPAIIEAIMAKFVQILWECFRDISKRSFKHHKNSKIACYPHNWLIYKKKMISFGNATSSHIGLIPLKTAYQKRGELLRAIASKKNFSNLHSVAFVTVFARNLVHAYNFPICPSFICTCTFSKKK